MRNAYLDTLYALAEGDRNVLALISDNGAVVYDKFRAGLPEQYLNMGISEQNMVSVAAGLASCGKIPFAYTIADFIVYRAFEQIRDDICLQNMNVKLVGIGAGFVYSNLGPTHHTTEDIALMRSLPNMTIFSPADPLETKYVTRAAAEIRGPVYIRLATGGNEKVYSADYDFKVGRSVVLGEGRDITLISTGSIVPEVMKAARLIEAQGKSVRALNIHTIKPFDHEAVLKAVAETGGVMTVEEQNIAGGLGGMVAEIIAECGKAVKFRRIGLMDSFSKGYGTYDDLKEFNGLSKAHIVQAARQLMGW